MRKCAGTTVTEIMNFANWRYVGKMIQSTEGIPIDTRLLRQDGGLMTVVSLGEPIERIISLYWYEHASHHYMKKNESKIASFDTWFDAWRDGSEWKKNITARHPGNIYLEVDNYFTKALSEWKGEPVTDQHLERAKSNLNKFDVVLIKEWMSSITQINAIYAGFPTQKRIESIKRLVSDNSLKTKLAKYAGDISSLRQKVVAVNKFDMLLYEYALTLAARRLVSIVNIVQYVKGNGTSVDRSACSVFIQKEQVGIHRSIGHKGPFI